VNDQVLLKVDAFRRQCVYVSRGHYLAAESYAWQHRLLGIPVVAGSTALASSIFAGGAGQSAAWTMGVGIGAALVAVLAALQTFLRLAERSEAHRTSAVKYGEVRRQLEIFQVRLADQRDVAAPPPIGELELFAERLGHLAATGPHLPARYYRRARSEQEAEVRAEVATAIAGPTSATPGEQAA